MQTSPYLTIDSVERFKLPNGDVGTMADIVTIDDRCRYVEEVKMIQAAFGAAPDGIFGPETRAAIRRAVTLQKR